MARVIVSRKQAGLVVAAIGALVVLGNALGVILAATAARLTEVARSGAVMAVAVVLVVASYRFAVQGTRQRVVWWCLGLLALDAMAGIVTRTSPGPSIVLLVILAGCFLLSLGHEAG